MATATSQPTATETPSLEPLLMVAAVAPAAAAAAAVVPAHGDSTGGGYSPTTDSCARCHRTHGAPGSQLRTAPAQEQTCYTCHNGTGGPNIQAPFGKISRHPTDASPEVHRVGELAPSSFSGGNRHVECVDCHDPHSTGRGTHTQGSSSAPGSLQGSWGIDVANGAAGTTPAFTRVSQVAAEYQLCFKCHSSWAYGSSPPTSHSGGIVETDQAVEFNVNNASYHWVEGDKTPGSGALPRTNDGRNMTFVAGSGWTRASQMTCSDCHGNNVAGEPQGPHGSANAYLLKGTWNTSQWGLCVQCHNSATYVSGSSSTTQTGFSGDGRNLHTYHVGGEGYGCQSCHSAVPHGGEYRALLAPRRVGNTTLPVTSYNQNSRLTVNSWPASGNWSEGNCSGCH